MLKMKKIISILMIGFILLNVVQPVFAASGTGTWVGQQYESNVKTTENADKDYGVYLRKMRNTATGAEKTVFCAEHGVGFRSGIKYNGSYYTVTDPTMKKACKVAYFGWYQKYGNYVVGDEITTSSKRPMMLDYVFSQQYIWEIIDNANDRFLDANLQAQYENFKTNINNKIAEIERRPSFNDTTISISAGETRVIEDTNGELSKYSSINVEKDGVKFVHNKGENTMTISVNENASIESLRISDTTFKSFGLIKEDTEDLDTNIFFELEDDIQNQLYALNYNDPVSLNLSLQIELFGRLELQKLDSNGKLINGATFNVKGENFNQDVKVTNGKIIIEKLRKGTYTITEKSAPSGYLLDTKEYNVEIKVNQTTTQAVINVQPTGIFTLIKKNADKSANLKGAEYRIWNANYDKTFATNENGEIKVEGLKLGTYNYQETKAPEGYLVDNTTYKFEIKYKDQNTSVIFENAERTNDEPTGTITIIKKDAKTGTIAQGDATFNGAVYKVYAKEDIYNKSKTRKFYSKDDLVATRNMNEKGQTEDIKDLPLGKYVVKEDVASKGYMLDTKEYEVELKYKDQNTKIISNTTTSLEKVKEMGIHIFKSGIKEMSGEIPGLEGAEFTIKLNSDIEKAYKQGYTYAEIWNGIDENGNKVKVDSGRLSKVQELAPTIEIITTDKDGNAYTQNKLPYGKYIVKETKTPTDYETAVDFAFTISDDESEIKEIAKKTKHIVVNNEQLETYIKLIKKDVKTNKVVTLNSTTFEIRATKDIYDRATNKILFRKGESISQKVGNTTYTSFTTNAKNIVIPVKSYNSENDDKGAVTTPLKLPVGSYEITELKVPNGFLVLDTPVTFDIKNLKDYDTDVDGDFIKEVIVKNEQPTGTINLNKNIAIREKVDTSLINISDLSGIEFKLSAKQDVIDYADGSKIYNKGQEIKRYNLTKDGKLTIQNLPIGVYEIEETKTLDGLVLNKTKYEVKFEQKDQVTKVYENKLDITNDTTLVEFSKTDITGDKELVGAKLSVTDENGKVIDTWISTENTHKIEALITGKEYILREEIAPNGYVVATEIKFTIKDTNEIQKVVMIDKLVEITKTDLTTGEELEGAELEVTDEEGNIIDKWTSTKEPHQVKGLEEGKKYTLTETTCPYGYEQAESITFEVSKDKETQKVVMKDMPILKNIKVIKVDAETKEIIKDKFSFAIYEDPECTKLIKEVKSNKENGFVEFTDLRFGVYYIKETNAPKGYELSNRIAKVEINDKGIFVDDTQVQEIDSTITFEFENKKVETPKTGDSSHVKLAIGVAILALLGLAWLFIKIFKRN